MKQLTQNQYPAAGDSLRDLWIELQLAPPGAAAAAPDASASSAPAAASSGGTSGSGSGGMGYGLDLIVPDRFSRERIMRIMRSLRARDAAENERQ